jgi:hypothetical protein
VVGDCPRRALDTRTSLTRPHDGYRVPLPLAGATMETRDTGSTTGGGKARRASEKGDDTPRTESTRCWRPRPMHMSRPGVCQTATSHGVDGGWCVQIAWAVLCLLAAPRVTPTALARVLPATHASSSQSGAAAAVLRPVLNQATLFKGGHSPALLPCQAVGAAVPPFRGRNRYVLTRRIGRRR